MLFWGGGGYSERVASVVAAVVVDTFNSHT